MYDPNAHVASYLSYFVDLPRPPRYAVMISGPWGVGKTFVVRRFLDHHLRGERKPVYVSLFGATSTEDIDRALFQAAYPMLSGKPAQIGGRLLKAAFKFVSVEIEDLIDPKRDVSPSKHAVFVFDDLERCEMPKNVVLGYLNELVEHDGLKVIVLANEDEIVEDGYARRREKLIGKTLLVRPAFDDALTHFIDGVEDASARDLFHDHRSEIATIYHQSKTQNLRILQQTLWDFERFYRALSSEHRRSHEGVLVLMRLFFALSMEVKSGGVTTDQLKERVSGLLAHVRTRNGDKTSDPFWKIAAKYVGVSVRDDILSNELLVSLLVDGLVDQAAIADQLKNSRHFSRPEDEPAWRTVWHGFERGDAHFNTAWVELERQYHASLFTDPYMLLHLHGLRLWLSELGLIEDNAAAVTAGIKCYVDALSAEARLDVPAPPGVEPRLDRDGAYGLAYMSRNTDGFGEVFEHLGATLCTAYRSRFPVWASSLLELMSRDPQAFLQKVCWTDNQTRNDFWRVPILATLDPSTFLDAVMALEPEGRHTVFIALQGRYERDNLDRYLEAERNWLLQLYALLMRRADETNGIARWRLQRYAQSYLSVASNPANQHLEA